MRVESAKGRYSLKAVVLAELPDRLRLEAFNPFGQTVGVLIQDKGKSTLWIPSEKMLYTASRTEKLTGHFLGVPVPTGGIRLQSPSPASPPPTSITSISCRDGPLYKAVAAQQKKDWSLRLVDSACAARARIAHRSAGRPGICPVNYEPAADLVLVEAPRKIRFSSSRMADGSDGRLRSGTLRICRIPLSTSSIRTGLKEGRSGPR